MLKQKGWKSIVRELATAGRIVVTNHREPEAVILSLSQYKELVERTQQVDDTAGNALAALRQQFDKRLAALDADDASDRLRALMRAPESLVGTSVASRVSHPE
ncbi:type II toxin-antitoxin system prevent-host-death family antitoxin [Castellaniella sp.]|uniref:type II toxin-antitoxin system prevent-host-death family antitoxin n=1 Tax=Castellaniella sp. TaxID=1955812 RepID=UPI0032180401